MVQKEVALGLSEEEKPYGERGASMIENNALVYRANSNKKRLIEMFIGYLEGYFGEEEIFKRKEMLVDAKALSTTLRDIGEEPKHFIVNRQREKVWYILESNFAKTLKQFDIDLFIEKVRLTRLQYQNDFDEMKNYQDARKKAIKEIMIARDKSNNEEIDRLQNFIDHGMDIEIKPLLLDTKKVMDSLDYMLEDLPTELNNSQTSELQQFIPAISEYYIDQCHRISGGYAYTPLAKNLKQFQKDINNNVPVSKLLDTVKELDNTMQHLYILHWIGENIMKNILSNKKSMGVNIRQYPQGFKTTTALDQIIKAVDIRNNIAHNGLIWNPEEITFAIKTYRKYIEQVSTERKLNLKSYKLPKYNQKITPADKIRNNKDFFLNQLKIDREDLKRLDAHYVESLEKRLEKHNWKIEIEYKDQMLNKIKIMQQNDFSVQTFGFPMFEVTKKLIAFEQKNSNKFDAENQEQVGKVTKALYWLYYNREHENAKRETKKILKKIEKMS